LREQWEEETTLRELIGEGIETVKAITGIKRWAKSGTTVAKDP